MDELAREYATLGVSPGSSHHEVRKRYKALVRKWHPDRFASDPQGQAEAAVRMRTINDAFRSVLSSRVFRSPAAPVSPGQPSPQAGRRLTREEIDRMVESLGKEGPLDSLFEGRWFQDDGTVVGKVGRAMAAGLLIAVYIALRGDAFGLSGVTMFFVMVGAGISVAALMLIFPNE